MRARARSPRPRRAARFSSTAEPLAERACARRNASSYARANRTSPAGAACSRGEDAPHLLGDRVAQLLARALAPYEARDEAARQLDAAVGRAGRSRLHARLAHRVEHRPQRPLGLHRGLQRRRERAEESRGQRPGARAAAVGSRSHTRPSSTRTRADASALSQRPITGTRTEARARAVSAASKRTAPRSRDGLTTSGVAHATRPSASACVSLSVRVPPGSIARGFLPRKAATIRRFSSVPTLWRLGDERLALEREEEDDDGGDGQHGRADREPQRQEDERQEPATQREAQEDTEPDAGRGNEQVGDARRPGDAISHRDDHRRGDEAEDERGEADEQSAREPAGAVGEHEDGGGAEGREREGGEQRASRRTAAASRARPRASAGPTARARPRRGSRAPA